MTDLTALTLSNEFLRHETGRHPENKARLTAIHERLQQDGFFDNRAVLEPTPATADSVATIHYPEYIEMVRSIAELGGGHLDPDTIISPGSYDAALLGFGAAQGAVDNIVRGEQNRAFVFPRPPGHHAEPDRGMGFCLFNNIAGAAQHAIDVHGMDRVAIVDWDVHHGNGTQRIFYETEQVLFISLHQWPLFPGSGRANERGTGRGEGYTLNIPMHPGTGDERYRQVFDDVVSLQLREYHPDLILVSAGYDAHSGDPLAMLSLTDGAFAHMGRRVRELADELCDGRVILLLEGGYKLEALASGVAATLDGVDGTSIQQNRSEQV